MANLFPVAILIKARLRHVQSQLVPGSVKYNEHSGPVQGICPYNHDSDSADYKPVSYINIFCEELVEPTRRAY